MFNPNWSAEGDREIRKQFLQDAEQWRLAATVRPPRPHRFTGMMRKAVQVVRTDLDHLGVKVIAAGRRMQQHQIHIIAAGGFAVRNGKLTAHSAHPTRIQRLYHRLVVHAGGMLIALGHRLHRER